MAYFELVWFCCLFATLIVVALKPQILQCPLKSLFFPRGLISFCLRCLVPTSVMSLELFNFMFNYTTHSSDLDGLMNDKGLREDVVSDPALLLDGGCSKIGTSQC